MIPQSLLDQLNRQTQLINATFKPFDSIIADTMKSWDATFGHRSALMKVVDDLNNGPMAQITKTCMQLQAQMAPLHALAVEHAEALSRLHALNQPLPIMTTEEALSLTVRRRFAEAEITNPDYKGLPRIGFRGPNDED